MPISPDGTITAPPVEGRRYVTRVVVEATYPAAGDAEALIEHAKVIGYLTMMTDDLPEMDFNLGYAKKPAALPEGGGEDGLQTEARLSDQPMYDDGTR